MKPLADGLYRILGEGAIAVMGEARRLELSGKKVLHFEIGQPDFSTPQHVKQAGIQAIEDDFTGYSVSGGIPELKQVIQDEVETTRGFRPSQNQVIVMPGGKPGIYFTMVGLCNPGDEVIYPDPGFPTYGSLCQYIGAKPLPIQLKEENDFRLDPEDIEARLNEKTKLIILNSPQNPTGSVMTKSELERVAELAEENDCFILSDEIYSKILYDTGFYSATIRDECNERSILLDGFSKAFSMTGWRLGYIIGPEPFIEKIETLTVNAFSCTPEFVQRAGIAALTGSQEELLEMIRTFKKRRDAIVAGLNTIPGFTCKMPEGAFYAWPNITETGMSSQEMTTLLLQDAGVACLPGTDFGLGGEGYLRFSYATSLETISEAIGCILKSSSSWVG
ncbi:MAG: pyridoxal phosphate-dependent aminotransferase [Candidatus Thorarchaeota archaeon]|jgi:aspartate/methionine/tyrosine aminotransferase